MSDPTNRDERWEGTILAEIEKAYTAIGAPSGDPDDRDPAYIGDAVGKAIAALRDQLAAAESANEHDRCVLHDVMEPIKKALDSRSWMAEQGGEWADAYENIKKAHEPLWTIVRDLSNSPKGGDALDAAKWRAMVTTLRSQLAAVTSERDALVKRSDWLKTKANVADHEAQKAKDDREWCDAVAADRFDVAAKLDTAHRERDALKVALREARPFVDCAAVNQRRFIERLQDPPQDIKDGVVDLFRKLERIDALLAGGI